MGKGEITSGQTKLDPIMGIILACQEVFGAHSWNATLNHTRPFESQQTTDSPNKSNVHPKIKKIKKLSCELVKIYRRINRIDKLVLLCSFLSFFFSPSFQGHIETKTYIYYMGKQTNEKLSTFKFQPKRASLLTRKGGRKRKRLPRQSRLIRENMFNVHD